MVPQEVRPPLQHQLGKSQYKYLQRQRHQTWLDMLVVVDHHPVVIVEDQLAVHAVAVVVLQLEDRHQ